MDHPNHFCCNLQTLKESKNMSLSKFSEELQIPRATMQAILRNGVLEKNRLLSI